jgi:hypothetical protein
MGWIWIFAGGSRTAVEEVAAYTRLLKAAQIGIGVLGRLKVMRPVSDCGDPGVQCL